MNDLMHDVKLQIHTCGRDYSLMAHDNYGYDPTPYSVLVRLADSGLIGPEDVLVDFGCGRGRVGFYMHSRTGCRTIGVDCSSKRIAEAEKNLQHYGNKGNISFVQANAEQYDPREANCFYFFNPFSPLVFRKVLDNISRARQETGKDMRIFFYYTSHEYRAYFLHEERLEQIDRIECTDAKRWDRTVYQILVFSVR